MIFADSCSTWVYLQIPNKTKEKQPNDFDVWGQGYAYFKLLWKSPDTVCHPQLGLCDC